jgi:hypothetical protein
LVFLGITSITNRVILAHKDKFGNQSWYDQVVTLETYELATLILPELGVTLQYNLGTVIQFCGILLMHLVSGWDKGYRVCHASFFRKDVFERLEVELPDWSTENNLKELGLNPLDL